MQGCLLWLPASESCISDSGSDPLRWRHAFGVWADSTAANRTAKPERVQANFGPAFSPVKPKRSSQREMSIEEEAPVVLKEGFSRFAQPLAGVSHGELPPCESM